MKKTLLSSLFLSTLPLLLSAQTGAGCKNAISIQAGYHVVDTMYKGMATNANVYPNPSRAIWYKFTPSQDGLLNISSCGGDADTRLFLYEGTCDTLNLFGYSDDFCSKDASGEETASDISKYVKAGKNYFIEWDNAWDSLDFGFSLSFATNFSPASMQACQSAKSIKAGITKVDSIIGIASRSDAGHSNWYQFTPTTSGKLSISTCGLDADTRLWVYKGSCGNLTNIAESDNDCDGATLSNVAVAINDIAVTANTTYYFEWDDSWSNAPFEFTLTFDGASGTNDAVLSKSIQLAPNPARDYVDIHFDLDKASDIQVRLFNSVGQVVFTEKYSAILRGIETIRTDNLQAGMYILSINDGRKQTNKKLVINR